MSAAGQIEAVAEGRRLVGRATAGRVRMRLPKGVVVRLHAPDDVCRSYKDIDFVAPAAPP